MCKAAGKTVGAEELDHVQRVEDRPDLYWDRSNWQGLCVPCRRKKTDDENLTLLPGETALLGGLTHSRVRPRDVSTEVRLALTGEANKAYHREYMRRHRGQKAAEKKAAAQKKKAATRKRRKRGDTQTGQADPSESPTRVEVKDPP